MNGLPLHRHSAPHRELLRRWRHYAAQQEFRVSTLVSVVIFAVSLFANFYAGVYATDRASNPVTDIILSNTPVFDVDEFFVYGATLLIAFIVLLCFAHPKRIPFVLHSLSLFYFIRAGFVSLTHIGPFPDHAAYSIGEISAKFFGGSDLFFSGHVGAPFLMALVFWKERNLRFIFLAWSAFFAVVVLLGHVHYSIDVASAYFITYTVYCIAQWLFPKDRVLFHSDVPPEAH